MTDAVSEADRAVSREALPGTGPHARARPAHRWPSLAVRFGRTLLTTLRMGPRLALVSRPGAWVPAALVYAGGVTISPAAGTAWSTWAGLAFVTMPMGLIVFGINDIADAGSDALNSRKGGAWGAVVQDAERTLLAWTAATCTLTFLLLDILTQHYLAGLSVLGIGIFACAYSLKPIRLKARPVLDSLSNGFWLACVFCCGYYASTVGFSSYHPPAAHILVALLLSGTAIHAITTLADREVDEQAGDTTIGVLLGRRCTLGLAATLFAACFLMVSTPEIRAYFAFAAALAVLSLLRPALRIVNWLVIAVGLMPLAAFVLVAHVR